MVIEERDGVTIGTTVDFKFEYSPGMRRVDILNVEHNFVLGTFSNESEEDEFNRNYAFQPTPWIMYDVRELNQLRAIALFLTQ